MQIPLEFIVFNINIITIIIITGFCSPSTEAILLSTLNNTPDKHMRHPHTAVWKVVQDSGEDNIWREMQWNILEKDTFPQ